MTDRPFYDGPRFVPAPPPDGVYALRAGLRCGRDLDHDRRVVTAATFGRLLATERAFRCRVCGATAAYAEGRVDPSTRRHRPAEQQETR